MSAPQDPFAGSPLGEPPRVEPVRRIRAAATKIRQLRAQIGHDGLTPSASRALIDELTAALEACAEALSGKE